jgi:methyl-accepting chemotaxis protein
MTESDLRIHITMTNRRKILVVNAVQQRRFIMGVILVTIILINSLAVFSVVFNPTLLDAFEVSHAIALAGLELAVVTVIGYFSLILSHRIAGPAHALARDLKKLADGDLTVEIHLRKGDFCMEAAEALNVTAKILRTRMKAIKLALINLEKQQNIDEATRQMIESALHEIAHFKTEPSPDSGRSPDESSTENLREPVVIVEMQNPRGSR